MVNTIEPSEMTLNRILIVADDFGADPLTNERIIRCYENRWISTSSVMVTMPSFPEVVDWYKSQAPRPKIGIHLDLDGGVPVSAAWQQRYGKSRLMYKGGWLRADSLNLAAVEEELDAQIRRFIDSGLLLGHIDSHHHIHTRFPVARVVVRLAKKYGGVRVRVAGNILYPTTLHKRTYRSLLNGYFKRKSNPDNHIQYFTGLKDFFDKRPRVDDTIELMSHPAKDADFEFMSTPSYREFLDNHELIG